MDQRPSNYAAPGELKTDSDRKIEDSPTTGDTETEKIDALVEVVAKKILGNTAGSQLEAYERGLRKGRIGKWVWACAGGTTVLAALAVAAGVGAILNPGLMEEVKDMVEGPYKTNRGLQPVQLNITQPENNNEKACNTASTDLYSAQEKLFNIEVYGGNHKTTCIDDRPNIKTPNFVSIIKACESTPSLGKISYYAVTISKHYPLCSKARKKY